MYLASDRTVSRTPLQGPRASTAEAEPSHRISITGLVRAVNERQRRKNEETLFNPAEKRGFACQNAAARLP